MIEFLFIVLLVVVAVWLGTRIFLRAPDHSRYDKPVAPSTGSRTEASPENERILGFLRDMQAKIEAVPRLQQTALLRQLMDDGFLGAPTDADSLGVIIDAVDVAGRGKAQRQGAVARRLAVLEVAQPTRVTVRDEDVEVAV